LAAPVAFALLFIGGYVLLYHFVLTETGKMSDPNWNLVITYQNLGRVYIARYSRPVVLIVAYLLLGVWPMFGEEFFYRGFIFQGLLNYMPPLMAACISSLLFGLRHAFQLAYLLPVYPFASGLAYFIWATVFGLLWSWMCYRTKSLWYCIGTHSINLFLAPFVITLLGK
jgi:membrane protease YdiL (CAAX protease family)